MGLPGWPIQGEAGGPRGVLTVTAVMMRAALPSFDTQSCLRHPGWLGAVPEKAQHDDDEAVMELTLHSSSIGLGGDELRALCRACG